MLLYWNKRNDLFIYFEGIEPLVYEKTATALDILPTLADLFALSYDQDTILGSNIFDSDHDGFYFDEEGTIKTDEFSYVGGILQSDVAQDEALDRLSYYSDLIDISYDILRCDYFKDRS